MPNCGSNPYKNHHVSPAQMNLVSLYVFTEPLESSPEKPQGSTSTTSGLYSRLRWHWSRTKWQLVLMQLPRCYRDNSIAFLCPSPCFMDGNNCGLELFVPQERKPTNKFKSHTENQIEVATHFISFWVDFDVDSTLWRHLRAKISTFINPLSTCSLPLKCPGIFPARGHEWMRAGINIQGNVYSQFPTSRPSNISGKFPVRLCCESKQ